MKLLIPVAGFVGAMLWLGGIIWRSFGEIPMWAHVLQGVGIAACMVCSICNIIKIRRKQTHE